MGKLWTRRGDLIYRLLGSRRDGKCMRCGWRRRARGPYCARCWKTVMRGMTG